MKIIQLILTKNSGGLGKHYIDLCNELSKNYSIVAICDDSYKSELCNDIKIVEISIKRSIFKLLNFIFLLKTLRKEKADIVHAHGNKAVLYCAKLKKIIPSLLIGTVHWNLKKNRDKKLFKEMDGVIGVSEGVLKNIDNPIKKVIFNGVNISSSQLTKAAFFKKYNLNEKKPIVVGIGRMVKMKGFDILIDSWKNIDAQLLLIGEGPYKEHLENLSKKHEICNKVLFLGKIDNAGQLLPFVDLCVIPSISEGFSYVLAEALIHKLPVIATSGVNGAKEIFTNKKLLVNPEKKEELELAIIEALKDLDGFSSKFTDTYYWAETNLSLKNMAESNFQFYKEIIENCNIK